jgi:hypothetical protein
MVLPFPFSAMDILGTAGLEQAKNLAGKSPPPDSNPVNDAESAESRASLSRQFAAAVNRRFEFQKRGQLFICVHNETLSVIAVGVHNPDCSPVGINRRDTAPTPTGFKDC